MVEEILRTTTSICPECMEAISADIFVDGSKGDNGWVMMRKNCEKHGDFMDKLSVDPVLYKWKNGYSKSLDSEFVTAPTNIEFEPTKKGCPYDCGLCDKHLSATCMMILDITNRCNLNCPICFANSNRQGRIVEYTYDEVVRIMQHFIDERPYHAAIAQFSGGEPTLHPRIIDLLVKAKEMGYPHRMLNTNGIRMAKDKEFCRQLLEADCGATYLSFDGLEPETYKKIRGLDLTKIKLKVIENCREVGLSGIMLVTTVVKGVNDHEVKAILEFARDNNDVVAGVVFQPVSLCGRIAMEDLMNLRYTNSDLINEIKRVTDGKIGKFYPLSLTDKMSQLIIWFADAAGWSISAHDDCGFATLVPIGEDGQWKAMEDYADLEGLVKWSNQVWDMIQKRDIPKPSKLLDGIKGVLVNFGLEPLLNAVSEFTDKMTDIAYRNAMKAYYAAGSIKYIKNFKPQDLLNDKFYFNIARLIVDPNLRASKSMLINKLMFVGSMHFQDAYDFDVERVQRCVVHYGVLDPKDENHVLQIPFCTFNTLHREPIETEWAKTHAKALDKTPEQHAKEVKTLNDSITTK
jgi:tetraether lipid synthase